jgi:hypothetical protein
VVRSAGSVSAAVFTTTKVTCPVCRVVHVEQMPTEGWLFLYVCPSCEELVCPRPGECCVFCSYADQVCPPNQAGEDFR